MKPFALLIAFLLELAAFAAFAYWGATTGPLSVNVILGVATPALAIAVWARWAAPRSATRLPDGQRTGLELVVFGAAAVALLAAGAPWLGAALAVVALGDVALLRVLEA
jgi:Protein of unknown function (DUF2568)